MAVLVFAAALATTDAATLRSAKGLLVLMALTLLLLAAHILPLPPAIWQALPQGDIYSRIDAVTGAGPSWRPFSLDPYLATNAFYSWFVPASVILVAARAGASAQERLLTLVLIMGAISMVLGMIQVFGGRDSAFYLYRITNRLSAVGLLANRNHSALLLAMMFPLIAAWVRLAAPDAARFRQLCGVGFAAMLIPAILATGSRAGIVLVIVGLASVPFVAPRIFRPVMDLASRFKGRTRLFAGLGLAAAVIAFVVVTVVAIGLTQGNSLDRLISGDDAEELRGPFWAVGWEMAKAYFPLGSGFGSFVQTFKMFEPHELLDVKYANHAHNDWLELFIEAGVPGVLLALGWAGWIAMKLLSAMRATPLTREHVLARAGGVAIVLMVMASFPDYPLRTPLIASLGALCAFWLALPKFASNPLGDLDRRVRGAGDSRRSR